MKIQSLMLVMLGAAAMYTSSVSAQATPQGVKVAEDKLSPGSTTDAAGQWLFKHADARNGDEKTEASTEPSGYSPGACRTCGFDLFPDGGPR